MSSNSEFKPGNTAPKSGEYQVVGPRGGKTGDQVTMQQGTTFPPTDRPNMHFEKVRNSGR